MLILVSAYIGHLVRIMDVVSTSDEVEKTEARQMKGKDFIPFKRRDTHLKSVARVMFSNFLITAIVEREEKNEYFVLSC